MRFSARIAFQLHLWDEILMFFARNRQHITFTTFFFLRSSKILCFDFRKIILKFQQSLEKISKMTLKGMAYEILLKIKGFPMTFSSMQFSRFFFRLCSNFKMIFENQNIIFFDDLKKNNVVKVMCCRFRTKFITISSHRRSQKATRAENLIFTHPALDQ